MGLTYKYKTHLFPRLGSKYGLYVSNRILIERKFCTARQGCDVIALDSGMR